MKPDCYECIYREDLVNSAHSCCKHPAATIRYLDPPVELSEIKVIGNPIGIKYNWFNFPYDFDPVWLEFCSGFKSKTEVSTDKIEE